MDNNHENTPDVNRTMLDTARMNAELEELFAKYPGKEDRGGDAARTDRPSSGSRYADKQSSAGSNAEKAPAGDQVKKDQVRVLSQRAVDEKAGKRRRQHRGLRILAGVLCVLVIIAALGAGGIWYLREKGRKELLVDRPKTQITGPEGAEVSPDGSYISWHGKHYKRNENVVSILVMGIDRDEEEIAREDELEIGRQGQADTILVGALDTQTGSMKIINISRDSMVDIDLFDVNGQYAGTEKRQICLAYAYGDGKETSCENVSTSVTRLLYGIPMDIYASIELPAVNVLNDAVGGVTLDVLEDLSRSDPALVKGAVVTLNGDQARIYVRSRDYESLDANNARMARQKQYLSVFLHKVQSRIRQNLSTILTLYQAAQTYMTTNIDLSRTAYLASVAFSREITPDTIVTVPGEVTKGEQFAEYHVDEDALYSILLDAYYEETDADIPAGAMTEADGKVESQAQTESDGSDKPAEPISSGEPDEERLITVDPKILH